MTELIAWPGSIPIQTSRFEFAGVPHIQRGLFSGAPRAQRGQQRRAAQIKAPLNAQGAARYEIFWNACQQGTCLIFLPRPGSSSAPASEALEVDPVTQAVSVRKNLVLREDHPAGARLLRVKNLRPFQAIPRGAHLRLGREFHSLCEDFRADHRGHADLPILPAINTSFAAGAAGHLAQWGLFQIAKKAPFSTNEHGAGSYHMDFIETFIEEHPEGVFWADAPI